MFIGYVLPDYIADLYFQDDVISEPGAAEIQVIAPLASAHKDPVPRTSLYEARFTLYAQLTAARKPE